MIMLITIPSQLSQEIRRDKDSDNDNYNDNDSGDDSDNERNNDSDSDSDTHNDGDTELMTSVMFTLGHRHQCCYIHV